MYPVGETSRAVGYHEVRKRLTVAAQIGAGRSNRPFNRLKDFVTEGVEHFLR